MTNEVFLTARQAWGEWAGLRARRDRFKRFVYGDQWSDPVTLPDGRTVSEYEAMASSGAHPLTNNLLRQIVKTVVGRYRTDVATEGRSGGLADIVSMNSLDELDARALEEFLISGCAIQRITAEKRAEGNGVWVDNVSPDRFFVNSFTDPRGHDIELVGMLHDMSLGEVLIRFGGGNRRREKRLAAIYSESALTGGFLTSCGCEDFDVAARADRCRVVEVWTLDSVELLACHDRRAARLVLADASERDRVESINARRRRLGQPTIAVQRRRSVRWRGSWFAPDGTLLATQLSPYSHGSHPFCLKLYPLIDGEVHPFIEDIVDQQRNINRSITLIDHILGTSAKGALLYPIESLPRGVELNDVAAMFSRPGAVIPVSQTRTQTMPQLLSTSANPAAAQLLRIEMEMMEKVSGVSSALQGQNVEGLGGSARLYAAQAENAAAAMRDIFDTFTSFRTSRNAKALASAINKPAGAGVDKRRKEPSAKGEKPD